MRALVVQATGVNTVCTRVFDIALGYPWPERFDERVLSNDFTDRWQGREDDLASAVEARNALAATDFAYPNTTIVDAGQAVGLVTEVRPAAAVVVELASGAARLLAIWAERTGRPATEDSE